MKGGWLYIMANRYRGTIYIGVTASLAERVNQHRTGTGSAFARKHGCDKIVLGEFYGDIGEAIGREKQLKKWNRDWKIRLIEEQNPQWEDRYADLAGL